MFKLITPLTIVALLLLPSAIHAQPQERDHREPSPRQERRDRPEREHHRDRPGERPERQDRAGQDDRKESQDRTSRVPVERIEEAFETIRAMHPDGLPRRLEALERAIKENPEAATRAVNRFPRLYELMEMRKHRPDEFQLHVSQMSHTRKAFRLVRQMHEARREGDDVQAKQLREALREEVHNIFTARLEIKRIEIERFKQRVQKAEQELATLQAEQEALIDKKLAELEQRGPGGFRDRRQRPEPDPKAAEAGDQKRKDLDEE